MNEDNDLWELVRQRVNKSDDIEILDKEKNKEEKVLQNKEDEEVDEIFITNKKKEKEIIEESINKSEINTIKLLNEGIFAGFIYLFVIMIILGILTVPGSITAAIGGFFGGKKAGDPARAMTAAMLPFLLIAVLYFLASTGALPPGSGPNDVSNEINKILDNDIDESALGPISRMPDSNSAVFVSVVTFAFIGGLIQSEEKLKKKSKN